MKCMSWCVLFLDRRTTTYWFHICCCPSSRRVVAAFACYALKTRFEAFATGFKGPMPINGVIINMTSWQSAFPLLPGFSVFCFFFVPNQPVSISLCCFFGVSQWHSRAGWVVRVGGVRWTVGLLSFWVSVVVWWKMRKCSYEFISNWGNMITAMMMLFRFNIVNIFRLSCVYLRALLAERRGGGVLWHPGQGRFVALTLGGWEVGWWRAACFSVEGVDRPKWAFATPRWRCSNKRTPRRICSSKRQQPQRSKINIFSFLLLFIRSMD